MADTYTVLSQKQNTTISPTGGGFVDVWDISYRVTSGPSKGTMGTVSVPEEDHNAEYVKKAIEEKIASLDSIASL